MDCEMQLGSSRSSTVLRGLLIQALFVSMVENVLQQNERQELGRLHHRCTH
jgi:hypothetical protein